LIGKVVEKSGNAWYNGFTRAVDLPYKSGFVDFVNFDFIYYVR